MRKGSAKCGTLTMASMHPDSIRSARGGFVESGRDPGVQALAEIRYPKSIIPKSIIMCVAVRQFIVSSSLRNICILSSRNTRALLQIVTGTTLRSRRRAGGHGVWIDRCCECAGRGCGRRPEWRLCRRRSLPPSSLAPRLRLCAVSHGRADAHQPLRRAGVGAPSHLRLRHRSVKRKGRPHGLPFFFGTRVKKRTGRHSPLASTARTVSSGPKSSALLTCISSARRVRARLTRDLIVPTAQPQIFAASS